MLFSVNVTVASGFVMSVLSWSNEDVDAQYLVIPPLPAVH